MAFLTTEPMLREKRLYDPLRGKLVASGPEEKVRQALLRWLTEAAKVPPRLIAVEYALSALDPSCRKRADLVVWEPAGRGGGLSPWLLAECKAPGVALDDRAADQVRRYAERVRAAHILLTNGKTTRYFRLGDGGYGEIGMLPVFGRM